MPAQGVTPPHLAEKIRTAGRELEGERKHVTVLFADVKESMDLAAAMDAEEWRGIMDRFVSILCDGVHRFEGTVDKFTGDGIMALFGAPIAHEDHARRACFAVLHLRDELDAYAAELRRTAGLNFSVRMGLNSGEVVVGMVGDDLSLHYTAVGHTVGLASRMESLAEPGTAYLTANTAALVRGHFDLADLGEFDVKGAPRPVRVFKLAGLGAFRTRLQVAAARGFSRFVGRDREFAALERALERTIAGEAQLVTVVGEAGVGKSRLFHEFARHCQARDVSVWSMHAQVYARAVPFLAVLELLRSYFGIADGDDDAAARAKIAARWRLLGQSAAEALPLILDFVGVADPAQTLEWLDPEARQRQLFAAFNLIAHVRSQQRPGVVLVENAQWLDPGSEAFLENLVEGLPGGRLMVLVNFRPEYEAAWMRTASQRISLSPLGAEAIDLLLDDLLGDDASLEGLAARIRKRTAGNPFFIEEVVRTLVEAGTLAGSKGGYRLVRPVGAVTIPATVQAVLAARIDRLNEQEKAVLQTASVIGAQFTESVLRRVTALPEARLAGVLRVLLAGEFIHERALYPEAEYAFTHALTEEVAYASQLSHRRAELHAGVAAAIEELYAGRLDERAALLAHHWAAAGRTAQAAHWSGRAAVWARRKDPLEARRHWWKVLELSRSLEETPDTVGLRIAAGWMILNFGCRLGLTEGQDIGDFEREMAGVYGESRALAERHEQAGGLAVLASTYAAITILTGHLADSAEHGREAITRARRIGDRALHVAVLPAPLYSLFVRGELSEALAATEEGLRLAGEDRSLGSAAAIASPYAWLLMMHGLLEGWTGDCASGKRDLERALEIAREDQDPETEVFSHVMLVAVAELAGSTDGVLEHAREAVEVAERSGGAFWQGMAYQYLGIARVLLGEWDDAITAITRALSIYSERNVGLEAEPMSLAFLARAHLGRGDIEVALARAQEATELACARGTKGWELYARHHRAQALLATEGDGSAAAAAGELRRALALVPITGASAFEPRLRRDLAKIARGAAAAATVDAGSATS